MLSPVSILNIFPLKPEMTLSLLPSFIPVPCSEAVTVVPANSLLSKSISSLRE